MFTPADRDRVREHVLKLASSDERIVAGALVGSLALSEGDRYSDLDLTFAVRDDVPILSVLDDWTKDLVGAFDAALLFDLPSGPSLYRVFLLPGCLQFDLSFTPAAKFGATGPKFRLLFGSAVPKPFSPPPSAHELFGYAIHHVVRARFCIERGRLWQAEYWISSARHYGLHLACLRRGLLAVHGRAFDDLPPDVLEAFQCGLVSSLDRPELLRALHCIVACILSEADEVRDLATRLEPQLRDLTSDWSQTV